MDLNSRKIPDADVSITNRSNSTRVINNNTKTQDVKEKKQQETI